MSINIPDSLPKLLVLIGIISIAVGVYVEKELTENYYSKFDEFDEIQDAVTLETYIVELEKKNLIQRAEQLSEILNIENPIIEQDSTITFTRTFSGDKKKVIVTDSLYHHWNNYIKKQTNLDILRKRKEIKLENINSDENILNSNREFYGNFLGIGMVVFIIGIVTWSIDSTSPAENIVRQNDKIYKHCQSCGHNFTSIRPYGTEKDRTRNFALCIECYKKGKLKEPDLTKEDFINRKKEEIQNFNWLSRKILLARFNSLERWNKDSYI